MKQSDRHNTLYESLEAVRAMERKLAVASSDPDVYYSSLAVCPADGEIVTDLKHAFQSPHDGHIYHSQTCAEVQLMSEDAEMETPDELNQD